MKILAMLIILSTGSSGEMTMKVKNTDSVPDCRQKLEKYIERTGSKTAFCMVLPK